MGAMKQFDVCGFGPVRLVSALKAAGLLKGAKVAVITSQAGSARWRFTQNKDKGPIVMLHPGFNRTTMTSKYSHIWDIEGAVPPAEGAKRVLHETAKVSMKTSGRYINCEDGLQIPF